MKNPDSASVSGKNMIANLMEKKLKLAMQTADNSQISISLYISIYVFFYFGCLILVDS